MKALIYIEKDINKIEKLLRNEDWDRSSIKITKGNKLKIEVNAKDAVALRATMTNVLQILSVFEKMKNGKRNTTKNTTTFCL